MPRVSILIPTYKRPKHLRECVESVLSSPYEDCEVFVLDQSPDEETKSTLESIGDSRLVYVHLNVPGKSRALNVGIERSTGEIICLVDDDCLVGPDWIEAVAREFDNDPRLDVVSGPVLPKMLDPNAEPIAVTRRMERIVYEKRRNPFGNSVGANVAYRREVVRKAGLFDENMGPGTPFKAVEDNEFFYRALKHIRRGAYVPEMVMYHKQWRAGHEAWERIDDYRLGAAVFIGKYLSSFDPWPGIWYSKHLVKNLYRGVIFQKKSELDLLRSELRILVPWTWKSIQFYRKNGWRK